MRKKETGASEIINYGLNSTELASMQKSKARSGRVRLLIKIWQLDYDPLRVH